MAKRFDGRKNGMKKTEDEEEEKKCLKLEKRKIFASLKSVFFSSSPKSEKEANFDALFINSRSFIILFGGKQ